MPGSLQKFMTAVENGNTGFIEWKSIDEKWTSYEVALKSVVNQVFYGPKATDTELKTFYDKVDRINQVMGYIGAQVEFTNMQHLLPLKSHWQCIPLITHTVCSGYISIPFLLRCRVINLRPIMSKTTLRYSLSRTRTSQEAP